MTASGGEATTTVFLEATRNGKHPIGILTSTLDKFINGGTTTEYMTQHVGTYLDEKYAKIESTSTREYYRVINPTKASLLEIGESSSLVKPTGLVASSVSYDVHGRQTTEYTVEQFRTYIDGHYAHLVSSVSKVYSDPPIISATPVYNPYGKAHHQSRLPKELIQPAKPEDKNSIPTTTVGSKYFHNRGRYEKRLRLDDLIAQEIKAEELSGNAIRARSIQDGDGPKPSPVSESEKTLPTFTVDSNGELNIPIPSIEVINQENEIEPTTAHRFEAREKATKTALDSVTYIGFVDFTTTIDDTVVIFRPKKTFRTATRNIFIPKIEPTQSVGDRINAFRPSAAAPAPALASSEPDENDRTSEPEVNGLIPKTTSGINPLKSLLSASASRRNRFSKSNIHVEESSSSASIQPSAPGGFSGRPRITLLQRPNIGGSAPDVESSNRRPAQQVPEPNEIASSIDPDSDVELVYKTLYTTYTYFTTFFRASTTRVKSREEVISNVITLTNILGPSDLAELKSSCEVDSTCKFISSTAPVNAFTNGFIGRPNTKEVIDEQPRSGDAEDVEVDGIFKTFFTTYTYFTTLFVDGSSSISTRTEVYSNIQSSGVPVSASEPPVIASSAIVSLPQAAAIRSSSAAPRRLEYSSIARGVFLQNDLTTQEAITDDDDDDSFIVHGVSQEATIRPSAAKEEEDNEIHHADENQIDVSSVAPSAVSIKTFYTTYTYFTTLFRNGTSFVTSNLETVTNTADPTASPVLIQPSVTFYTTFTYWTTSIDGDSTVITSREETKTDILPAGSITDQILPTSIGIGISFTEQPTFGSGIDQSELVFPTAAVSENEQLEASTSAPELESGEVDGSSSSSSATVTPSLASSVVNSADFTDLDDDFTLASSSVLEDGEEDETTSVSPVSRSKLTFTRPSSKTFTPVIKPNLFRTRLRPNARPRARSSTVATIITRSDVTPTLIATLASSPAFASSRVRNPQSSFSPLSRARASISSSSINPARASSSISSSDIEPTSTSEATDPQTPSIISGLSLRRPSPFKARLRQSQRARLEELRANSNRANNGNRAPSLPRIASPGGLNRAPIFVSSRTENIQRRPKAPEVAAQNEDGDSESSADDSINLPPAIATKRERARQKINALFRRRRPNFLRPKPAGVGIDPLEVQASTRRRKRQVSSNFGGTYGSRTRARQSYIRNLRSSSPYEQQPAYFQSQRDNAPFTAFTNAYTSYPESTYAQSEISQPYDDSLYYSSSSSASKPTSSPPRSRLVRQQQSTNDEPTTTRSRSRFNPAVARNRLRTRGQSTVTTTTTTTTPRPSFRFRPRTISNTRGGNNRFTSSGRRPASSSIFDYDYDSYDYDYDTDIQSSHNSVPDAITVTHTVPVMTKIPIFENGRNAFRDILTTSPSLEVIAVTALKSTNIDGSPVIYANAQTNTAGLGTQVLTFEALRATETTAIAFTPTQIRGQRTSFSHVVASTIYNIRPVTTSIIQQVDQNQILSSILLKLLGGSPLAQQPADIETAGPLAAAVNPLLGGLVATPHVPATQFITHTSTYVTTLTNIESTVVPITLRGREIRTTLIDSKTEVVTATEYSTETKVAPTQVFGGGGGFPIQPTAHQHQNNPHQNLQLPTDLQHQLLLAQLAQLQQQNKLQQQQLINQQLLSQVNLDPEGAINVEQTQKPDAFIPSTTIVTRFVSGSKPGDFTRITETVTLDADNDDESNKRYKRDLLVVPTPVVQVVMTLAPTFDYEESSSELLTSSLLDSYSLEPSSGIVPHIPQLAATTSLP
jgi:hypothetical protein